MRQAGRYLESYRKVRAKNDVLTICKTPELAAKVAVDATTELGVDAAIIFADIMLPLEGIGQSFKLVDGVGPVVEKPIGRVEDVKTIGKFSPKDHVPFVTDAIELAIQQLDGRTPLIGFSGAPFTLASYLIEGSPSREFTKTKRMMYAEPEAWKLLMAKLSGMVSARPGSNPGQPRSGNSARHERACPHKVQGYPSADRWPSWPHFQPRPRSPSRYSI